MNYILRKADARDYEAVNNIFQQAHQMHVAWRPDIYQPCDRLISPEGLETPPEGTYFFVAETDGKVVGILELVIRRIQSPAHVSRRILFIETMAVDEAYRGMGIGHQFFEKVKQLREEHGLDGIELQVNAKNRAAYEMYLKIRIYREIHTDGIAVTTEKETAALTVRGTGGAAVMLLSDEGSQAQPLGSL